MSWKYGSLDVVVYNCPVNGLMRIRVVTVLHGGNAVFRGRLATSTTQALDLGFRKNNN